ncbi:MAG: outer membrane beta-barrel protein [Rhodospirillales bacterium]
MIVSDSDVTYDSGGPGRRIADYNDASVLAGIEYRQSAVFVYRALAGYEVRLPYGTGLDVATLTAPAAELDLIWQPTRLVTLTGRVSQSLQDEPTDIAQGLTQTGTQLTLDYAFRRNVLLDTSVG